MHIPNRNKHSTTRTGTMIAVSFKPAGKESYKVQLSKVGNVFTMVSTLKMSIGQKLCKSAQERKKMQYCNRV